MKRALEALERGAAAFIRWWVGDVEQQRRMVEEDARRLGGTVMWDSHG